MINLIPPEGHRALKQEYYLRVVSTLALLFGAVFLLLTVAYIPTYVLINAQIEGLKTATREGEMQSSYKRAEEEVMLARKIMGQLNINERTISMGSVIDEVEQQAKGGVSFKNFSLERSSGHIERISVQGTAPTRIALSQFKNAIEASEMFETAEVPISDLARDTNLPFAISIALVKQK